tara:strand:+ start:6743 stop:7324 length:582 start_codon:yes stop_codon:yes gene_type:complete
MANTKDYMFNNMARIGNDNCDLSQRNLQSTKKADYLLTNFGASDCLMKNSIDIALSQPNINYSGTKQMALEGCNVDTNSNLMLGGVQTNPKCRIDLQERPYLTVPYLGRGAGNPVLESQLAQGEQYSSRKSIDPSSEKSYIPLSHPDLIPSLASTVTNPANLVEGVAAEGWIRGGVPSRELTKDYDYFSGKKQ